MFAIWATLKWGLLLCSLIFRSSLVCTGKRNVFEYIFWSEGDTEEHEAAIWWWHNRITVTVWILTLKHLRGMMQLFGQRSQIMSHKLCLLTVGLPVLHLIYWEASSIILLFIYCCTDNRKSYYAVAVIKKNTLPGVHTLHDLRGKKACFAGVGTLAGWVIPVYKVQHHPFYSST